MSIEIPFVNGEKIQIDDRCLTQGGSLLKDGPWDFPFLEQVFEELKKFKEGIFLDIGANTGAFTLLAKYLPDLQILSFEPGKEIYDILCENVRLNHLDNVKCYRKALSNFEGDGTLSFVKNWCGMSRMIPGYKYRGFESVDEKIAVCCLDKFIETSGYSKKIVMMKIDVEGCELEVLKGAIGVLSNHKPMVAIEYAPENAGMFGHSADDPLELLRSLGYKNFDRKRTDYIVS